MEVHQTFTEIETAFNVAGSMPIIGALSGTCRIAIAKIQFLAGGIIGIAGVCAQIFSREHKWEVIGSLGAEHMVHGICNALRGAIEVLLGITVIGSVVLFIGQLVSNNHFAPIIKYSGAPRPPIVFVRVI